MNHILQTIALVLLMMIACNAHQNEDGFNLPPQYLGELEVVFPALHDSLECKRDEFDSLLREAKRIKTKQRPTKKIVPVTLDSILKQE